jgi:hypothetical protein
VALSLQQIRDFVRSHLDIEEEDLPDAVLDVFINEGFQRCYRAERRWPFYLSRWTLNTVADTESYDLDDLDALGEITAIKGERYNLEWVGQAAADYAWPATSTSTSEPTHFQVEHRTLFLHPTPNDAYALTIKGYRTPTAMSTAGSEPDIDEDLHNTIATWALSRAYAQQDDPEMSSMFERQFADELNLFRRRLNSTPMQQPIVLGGGSGVGSPSRLRYDWE